MSVRFPASYIQVAKRLVQYKQGNIDKLVFERLGVDPSILNDLDASIDKEQFRIILQIIQDFQQEQPEEATLIFKSMPLTVFGAVGIAFMTAPAIRSLMDVSLKYFHTVMPAFTLIKEESADVCTVNIERLEDFGELNSLLTEIVLWGTIDTLSNVNISEQEYEEYRGKFLIEFPHSEPVIPGPWNHVPIEYRYGAGKAACSFPICFMDRELHTSNPAVMSLLEKDLRRLDLKNTRALSVTDRVSNYLKEALVQEKNPDLKLVADHLSMSERTLSRRLNEEGQSYKALLNKLKMEQGARLLRDTESYVREIAYKLGFSNEANFSRSFKSHYGVSPTDFRAKKD